MAMFRLLALVKGKEKLVAEGDSKQELKSRRDSNFSNVPTCIERGKDHPLGRSQHSGDKFLNSRNNLKSQKFSKGQHVRVSLLDQGEQPMSDDQIQHFDGWVVKVRRNGVLVEMKMPSISPFLKDFQNKKGYDVQSDDEGVVTFHVFRKFDEIQKATPKDKNKEGE